MRARSLRDTARVAAAAARVCGESVCTLALIGEMGTGKTTFARLLVAALSGGERSRVSSPTFALCHRHETTPPVEHFDLYRVADRDDLESAGWSDSGPDVVRLVEWADRIPEVLSVADLEIRFERRSRGRALGLLPRSERGERVAAAMREAARRPRAEPSGSAGD